MVKKLLNLLSQDKPKRISLKDRERQAFEDSARKQFLKLKEKGLSIPIVSL